MDGWEGREAVPGVVTTLVAHLPLNFPPRL